MSEWRAPATLVESCSASFEARRYDLHPKMLDYLARVGSEMLSPMNRHGGFERRLEANEARAARRLRQEG